MGILERGGNAFDAAAATAFTLQVVEPHTNGPGGDVPVIIYDVRKGKPEVDLRPGARAGRRDHRSFQEPGPRSCARHGAARGLRARHVRCLDAAVARLRHDEASRRDRARDLLRRARLPAGGARQRRHCHGGGAIPRALADLGRGLSAARQGAGARRDVHQQGARRDLQAGAQGGRERRRRPRAADREGAPDLVAGLRGRGHRYVLPHPGDDGHERPAVTAACSLATTWRGGTRMSGRP